METKMAMALGADWRQLEETEQHNWETTMEYNNQGYMGRNKYPQNEKSPPYTGRVTIDGKHYWVSSWENESKHNEGETYFSLKFKEQEPINKSAIYKDVKSGNVATKQVDTLKQKELPLPEQPEFDDDIPF